MAGVASRGSGDSRPYDGISSVQEGGATGEMLTECRSSEQLENGTPSTSPPFWDTDDDDEDRGLRPSQLYGKYTWKIDKFSQINKRELRSNAFEVGGYKWYILIYPQGCDVCNHLSLFLCVANHDKLLPGWSHFAQFTIAVANKDPKKSKYSDTLHRFWKKEHDWGWKKFMELSKVMDGFVDADTLIIKAQVQVIRERADRPFRCLDCQYRRELVRVYLTNVEQLCRRFMEEKRNKLVKLIQDKARWSSICAFWLAMDPKSKRSITSERTDTILRAIVKHFFIEKEVTSTLVMDSLYSGLRALEGQIKSKNGRCNLLGNEESPFPVVFLHQNMFVLIDDVLLLLERASLEPLPPKEDKGPQNRMKDGGPGDEFSQESIERDERRLTELGRRAIEIFVLAHIFGKIEDAYQEAVAFRRQEELIREEAAWLEIEQKSKRGAVEKEKKSKKKQAKQKRNNRKVKDKGRDVSTIANALVKLQSDKFVESKDSIAEESKAELEKPETFEDDSDVSDTVDVITEVFHADSEERESSPVNWDTDSSEVCPLSEASGGGASPLSSVQNEITESNGSSRVVEDSSSTCSTGSVPSLVINGNSKASSLLPDHETRSPTREKNQLERATSNMSGLINEGSVRASDAGRDVGALNDSSGSSKAASVPGTASESLQDDIKKVELQVAKGLVISPRAEPDIKEQPHTHKPANEKTTVAPTSPISSSKSSFPIQPKLEPKISAPTVSIKRPSPDIPQSAPLTTNPAELAASSRQELHKSLSPTKPTENLSKQEVPMLRPLDELRKSLSPTKPTEKPLKQKVPVTERPLSAPIVSGPPRPTTPVVSMVQSERFLSRSVSAVGHMGPDPTPVTHHHQSYRNAMMGTNILMSTTSTSPVYTQPQSPITGLNPLPPYSAPPNLIYPPTFSLQSAEYGMPNPPPMRNDVNSPHLFKQGHIRSQGLFPTESPACSSRQPSHNSLADEFPHLGIINDLLDDDSGTSTSFQSFNAGPQYLSRQFSYPRDNRMTHDILGGPSSSSCRFGRAHSYQENGFQSTYDNSLSSSFESIHDYFPQMNLAPFPSGQVDGLVPDQWQVTDSDMAYCSTRTMDANGYPYHIPDYLNLSGHSNGYVFRPSNGR